MFLGKRISDIRVPTPTTSCFSPIRHKTRSCTYLWKCRTRICSRTWKTARIWWFCRRPAPPATPPCTIPPCRLLWTCSSAPCCKRHNSNNNNNRTAVPSEQKWNKKIIIINRVKIWIIRGKTERFISSQYTVTSHVPPDVWTKKYYITMSLDSVKCSPR